MTEKRPKIDLWKDLRFSRRAFLKSGGALTSASLWGCFHSLPGPKIVPPLESTRRQYLLRREADDLFLQLITLGFREFRLLGHRWLQPIAGI